MLQDSHNRQIKDLRISITDRCNFRCAYCMPTGKYEWVDRSEVLTFEEVSRLAGLFVALGVNKIRLTGGEPLLRRHLEKLVGQLAAIPELKDLCLTTNGDRLSERIAALHATGLKRINVSIDTLDPEKFRRLTQRGNLDEVLKGIFAAKQLGLKPIKINAVIERGVNDDEILNLVDFSRQHGFIIRFIEYMDAGNANQWKSEKMVSKKEILEIIRSAYELKETDRDRESSPSEYFCFADGCGELGVIASVSEPFCMGCTRARLTVDGKLVTCLFSDQGHDLKSLLRRGASDAEVQDAIRTVWRQRKDRYSEERLVALQSQDGYQPGSRKKIEMIRLGG